MPCRRYILYLTWNKHKYRLGISVNPQIDLSYLKNQEDYENLAYLSPPLPLALSEYLLNLFSTTQERLGREYHSLVRLPFVNGRDLAIRSILNRKFRLIHKELAKFSEEHVTEEPIIYSNSNVNINYFSLHHYEDILDTVLQGRIYYLREISRRLRELNVEIEDLEIILHLLTLKGQVVRVPSVSYVGSANMSCNRCGHRYKVVKVFCSSGQKDCYYCQECRILGESKPCEALYAVPARTRPEESFVKSVRLSLDVTFSLAQYEAFESLARFVRKDSLSECLVWEACGAGRPETVFGAVREVLKRGGRVLFGVPRKDILDDLVARLERAFPGISVAICYGKSRSINRNANIILASTHHSLKFYKNFDLVILDESDAFPYRANPILINALRRAKKNDGKFIYMTPTPAPEIYARAQRGEIKVVEIPIRQHGHPLVVPRVVVGKEMTNEGQLLEMVFQFTRESLEEDQSQLLVVVPDAVYSNRVGEWLTERLAGPRFQGLKEQPVVYTNSRDSEKERKVAAYFRGEHNVLVTTNLTSRGDRAPNSNMIVLWAESEIFDEGCLLQLAGRIGWCDAYPGGKVWFIASRMTRDIEGAVRKIKLLNEDAQKKGYLDSIKQRKYTARS